jgi:hypothetical protein
MHLRAIGLAAFLVSFSALAACSGARSTGLDGPAADGDGSGGSRVTPPPSEDPAAPGDPDAPSDPKNPPDPKKCSLDPTVFDVPGNGLDDDCNGKIDDEILVCDGAVSLASTDAFEAAKALGLCKKSTGNGWGVIDAKYVRPVAYGLLPSFGVNAPLSGSALLALSSGSARAPSQPGYQSPTSGLDRGYTHELPAGFSRTMPACPGVQLAAAHDGVALEVRVRVPRNARSFSFSHHLFTSDYSEYVCSEYNDAFAVLMTPKPADRPDGNVVVDATGAPVGTNSTALLRACTPATTKNLSFACPLGTAPLAGTGFEGHASTGWLKTTVPVTPGSEITLRFAIWDSGDGVLDSTVLVDAFAFSADAVTATKTEGK